MVGGIIRVWVCLGSDILHFEHGNHWEESNEKQEQEDKESDRSDEEGDIDPSRGKIAPR